ncbi:MAG TPA: class I SAM-dependent methyltransferase [Steroidobacteraceae bacterium]|nr:class I SAM-dependent methyltransferase [Steroidobacteraceae bacterium]
MTAKGLLGDSAGRDYSRKLSLFNACAQPELRQAIASLQLRPGMHAVDVGCGTGETLGWLQAALQPGGRVVGVDLAAAHLQAARRHSPADILIAQADALRLPLRAAHFDLVWCVNTLNHLREPVEAIRQWGTLLRNSGRIALGQSSLLPEMFFAWDARLERIVNDAVRQYYRERYGVSERELTAVRALLGVLRQAKLRNVWSRTFMIERISPLHAVDEIYLTEAIFRDTWGERLRPYLEACDYAELCRLCDPADPAFALRRPDFHYLQSFTLVVGER